MELYLPLKIKTSSCPNAGLGVFATKDLPPYRLVCSYLGEVGVGRRVPALRDYG